MLRRLSLVIALSSLSVYLSVGQSPVRLDVAVAGGLLTPLSSVLKGDVYSVHDYPLSNTGYSLATKVRLSTIALPFRVVAGVNYHALTDNAVLPVATLSGTVNSKYTNSLSIVAFELGAEYSLLTSPLVSPYVSGSLTMNLFSGSAKYENDVIPEAKLNSATRYGFNVGVGSSIDIAALPFSLDLDAKYHLANIIGQGFDSMGYSYSGFGGIPQTATYNLNDAKNPNDSGDHSRSIGFLTLTLSFNFRLL